MQNVRGDEKGAESVKIIFSVHWRQTTGQRKVWSSHLVSARPIKMTIRDLVHSVLTVLMICILFSFRDLLHVCIQGVYLSKYINLNI